MSTEQTRLRVILAGSAVLWIAGCGQTNFGSEVLDTDLTATTRIVNDADLTGDEKRQQLAALGIPDTTINALLRDDRTANQFGGTLETAFNKVTGDGFASLTPDEIQLYGDASEEVTYSDQQGQAIASLFREAEIDNANELERYLDTPGAEFPPDVDSTDLRAVFVDFNPDDVLDDLP